MERGLAPTRERAQAVIMAGLVRVGGQAALKSGSRYPREASIEVLGRTCPYVSRGGLKLAHALEVFGLPLAGSVCVDVGASTGGFTDCMLQNGARRVYAIDVGYGQLDQRLRDDPRVVSRERVNARGLDAGHVPEMVDVASVDVSFISLTKVLPAVVARMKPHAHLVALVKPQFEAGRHEVGRNGVVRKPAVHARVLVDVMEQVRVQGLQVCGLAVSPLRGPAGNIEFLLWATPGGEAGWDAARCEAEAGRVVDEAHAVDTGDTGERVDDAPRQEG